MQSLCDNKRYHSLTIIFRVLSEMVREWYGFLPETSRLFR